MLLPLDKSCICKYVLVDKFSLRTFSAQKLKIIAGTYFRPFRNVSVNLFLCIGSKRNILGRGKNLQERPQAECKGEETSFRKKMTEHRLFQKEKLRGWDFSEKKMMGRRLFQKKIDRAGTFLENKLKRARTFSS